MMTIQRGIFFLILVFILFQFFFLLVNWRYLPGEIDTPYHLLMGKMFADHGGVVLWDSYEFVPLGRPHLYPPLEHILIWIFRVLFALSYMDIGRLLVVVQIIGGLGVLWFVTRRFFDDATALCAMLFYCSSGEVWHWQTSVAPSITAILLAWVGLLVFYRRNFALSVGALTACFYLHYGIAFVLLFALVLATLASAAGRRSYGLFLGKVLGGALILYAPWLFHLGRYSSYLFKHVKDAPTDLFFVWNVHAADIVSGFNIVYWICLGLGLIIFIRRRQEDFKYPLFLAAFSGACLFLLFFEGKRFQIFSLLAGVVLAGVAGRYLLERCKKNKRFGAWGQLFCAFILFFSVFIEWNYIPSSTQKHFLWPGASKGRLNVFPAPLLDEIMAWRRRPPVLLSQNVFLHKEDIGRLLVYLKKNVKPDEIIHLNIGGLANTITLETGLKTDVGTFWEVITPDMMKKIYDLRRQGVFISTIKNFDNLLPYDLVRAARFPVVVAQFGRRYVGRLH